MASRAHELHALGQSVWLDYIHRGQLVSGEFDRLVRDAGVVGVTSNPTIFHQAITQGDAYDRALGELVAGGLEPEAIFDALSVADIQTACDRLRPTCERTRGLDGRVSIEVGPALAYDTAATLAEARRLHRQVARDNIMVKIPATREGLPAITAATADGICVNITLIFSLARYEQVMDAYLQGLERRAAKGQPLGGIFSVASFFVSRVDNKVDAAITAAAASLPAGDARRRELESFLGKAAVANARLAYERFRAVFHGGVRFEALRGRGATVQRPLWASTSTKNPSYPDTLYVDELVGPETVNTMPPQTIDAFRDHGVVRRTIDEGRDHAHAVLDGLAELGISMQEITDELQRDGVELFAQSFRQIGETTAKKARTIAGVSAA
jgi:transaldolase